MTSENDKEMENKEAALLEIFNRLEKKLDSIIALLEEGNDTEEDDSEDEDLADDDDEEGEGGKKKPFGSNHIWKQSNGYTHPGSCKRFVPRYNPYSRPRGGNY